MPVYSRKPKAHGGVPRLEGDAVRNRPGYVGPPPKRRPPYANVPDFLRPVWVALGWPPAGGPAR